MEFRILGPLEVVDRGQALMLGGPKPRALLARLLLSPNEAVSVDRISEAVWGTRPPEHAANALQYHVSQLRRLLGETERIVTRAPGYLLRVQPDELDLLRFERLVGEAEHAAPDRAARLLRSALELWRGPPLADLVEELFAVAEVGRLEELRLAALERRVEADLALGGAAELVPELERLVSRHPLRERLLGQLMLALYRSGRQAEALAAYRDARRTLVATLGIEPESALRQLERAILEQDPALDMPTAAGAGKPAPRLPGRSSSFVGRKRELGELRSLLEQDDARLLTLTGAAGSGKTRLAIEAVGELETGSEETFVVELAPIADASLVAGTIADQLGIRVWPGRTPDQALLDHLRDRQARLLLDNFEHVLGAAPQLGALLAAAPGLRLLVTSRTPLGIAAEQIYPVPPLELPDPSRPRTLARLRRTEAIRLFCERAREVRPDFELTKENADAVAELCVRLDGLPLALELAAARSNVLSPGALLERLGGRPDLLKAAPGSGLAERHRTLRTAIEWSYDLLGPELQELFTSLGVFAGGFTLGSAEAVAAELSRDVSDDLESLLASNLLTSQSAHSPEPRLGMLVTLREYALDRLAARGDGDAVRRRHADFYVALADEAGDGLLGPDQLAWLERLDAELDNIRAALNWAAATGEAEIGLRIAAPLWRFWNLRNREREARERLEQLLSTGSATPATRATGQSAIAGMAQWQGDGEAIRRMCEASIPVHRQVGNDRWLVLTLGLLVTSALGTGDIEEASALSRDALAVARSAGDRTAESYGLAWTSIVLAARGRLAEAESTFEEAVRLAREVGNLRSVGSWSMTLAGFALIRDDRANARRLFEESLAVHRHLSDAWGIPISLMGLAYLALQAGENETARKLLAESLAPDRDYDGYQPGLADELELSARLAAAGGHLQRAVEIYATAGLLREAAGAHVHEVWWKVWWPDPTPDIDELRSRLGSAEFEQAWARGRAKTVRETIRSALEETRLQHV